MHRLLGAFLLAVLLVPGPVRAQGDCAPDRLDIRSGGSSVRFSVEVVDTPKGRAVGLMNRPSMGKFAGMLFVYPDAKPVSFWMRNTLIPLDMLFIGADGVVDRVHENAIPLDETPIFGGEEIQYVVEINGGMAGMLGIGAGAEVRHPAISGPDVVWSCD